MGLDMYLSGKRYLSSFNDQDKETAESVQKLMPELKGRKNQFGDGPAVKEIKIDAGYWRKANAIHAWFVKHVQDGEDRCRPHYVSREMLEDLRDTCQRVLDFKHLANELLPTQSGFFFGETEFNEWYYQDLEQTVKIIDKCLELPSDWEFEYCSSW